MCTHLKQSYFVGNGGALRKEFAGTSVNTRRMLDCDQLAVDSLFFQIKLLEILGIKDFFSFG